MTKNSSTYHCPKCGKTVEVFVSVIAVHCWRCGGRRMKQAKVPIQPVRLEAIAASTSVEVGLF